MSKIAEGSREKTIVHLCDMVLDQDLGDVIAYSIDA